MQNLLFKIIIPLLLVFNTNASAIVFKVDDYGATPGIINNTEDNNNTNDDAPGVRLAIEAAKEWRNENLNSPEVAYVTFSSGQYNFKSYDEGNKTHIYVGTTHANRPAKNISIQGDANGGTLLVSDVTYLSALRIDKGSEDISIANLKFDYLYRNYSQGTISSIHENENKVDEYFKFKSDPRFLPPTHSIFNSADQKWGFVVDSDKHFYSNQVFKYAEGILWATKDKPNDNTDQKYTIRVADGTDFKGNKLVLNSKVILVQRKWNTPTIFFRHVKGLAISNVTVYQSPGIAMELFNNSSSVKYPKISIQNYQVRIRADDNSNRLVSTVADAIHSHGNRAPLLITNCVFEGMADDAINLHSRGQEFLQYGDSDNKTIEVYNRMTTHFKVGDEIAVMDTTTQDWLYPPQDKIIVDNIDRSNPYLWRLTVRMPLSGLENKHMIFNMSRNDGNELNRTLIYGNTFLSFRGRGVVLNNSNNRVINNTFRNSYGSGVSLIYTSANVNEGPMPTNNAVSSNHFYGTPRKLGATNLDIEFAPAINTGIVNRLDPSKVINHRGLENNIFAYNKFYSLRAQALWIRNCKSCRILGNKYNPDDVINNTNSKFIDSSLFFIENSDDIEINKYSTSTIFDRDDKTTAALRILNCSGCTPQQQMHNSFDLSAPDIIYN